MVLIQTATEIPAIKATLPSSVFTVDRLNSLAPGERMVAYVGNLELDIDRCRPMSHAEMGSPLYSFVLEQVKTALDDLKKTGKIELVKRHEAMTVKTGRLAGQTVHINRYIATALR